MSLYRCFLCCIVFSVFLSCKNDEKPKALLAPGVFRSIFWEMNKASVYTSAYIQLDSLKNDSLELAEMKKNILSHYKVTAAVYEKSKDYYMSHPDEIIGIIDTLQAQQKSRKEKRKNNEIIIKR